MAVTLKCEDMCITNISIVNPSSINCTCCRLLQNPGKNLPISDP